MPLYMDRHDLSGATDCDQAVSSVGARGFEPLTSSASRKRSPPELSARESDGTGPRRGGDRNRTGVRGFAGPCLTTRPPRRMRGSVYPSGETGPSDLSNRCACGCRRSPATRRARPRRRWTRGLRARTGPAVEMTGLRLEARHPTLKRDAGVGRRPRSRLSGQQRAD